MYILVLLLWLYGLLDNFGIVLGNNVYFCNLTCIHLDQCNSCFFDVCIKDNNCTKVCFVGYYLVTSCYKVYNVPYTPLPNSLTLQYQNRGGKELLYPQASHVTLNKPNLILHGNVRKGRVMSNQSQQITSWP
jgi:hypothetical protein